MHRRYSRVARQHTSVPVFHVRPELGLPACKGVILPPAVVVHSCTSPLIVGGQALQQFITVRRANRKYRYNPLAFFGTLDGQKFHAI